MFLLFVGKILKGKVHSRFGLSEKGKAFCSRRFALTAPREKCSPSVMIIVIAVVGADGRERAGEESFANTLRVRAQAREAVNRRKGLRGRNASVHT